MPDPKPQGIAPNKTLAKAITTYDYFVQVSGYEGKEFDYCSGIEDQYELIEIPSGISGRKYEVTGPAKFTPITVRKMFVPEEDSNPFEDWKDLAKLRNLTITVQPIRRARGAGGASGREAAGKSIQFQQCDVFYIKGFEADLTGTGASMFEMRFTFQDYIVSTSVPVPPLRGLNQTA